MKRTISPTHLLLWLALISIAVIGILIGCSEKKHVSPPVIGPAAGSGPTGGGDTQDIELSASPSGHITVTNTEQATVKITAVVKNGIGQPMPDGTVIYWSASQGTLDSVTSTSANGASTVTLTFRAGFNGCSDITARSGDAEETIWVCVSSVAATPTPSRTFIVSSQYSTLSAAQTQTTISATAKTNGTPDVGLQVNFTVSGPGTLNASAATTDSSGTATVTLTRITVTSTQTVTVTATSADGRSGTVQVIVN